MEGRPVLRFVFPHVRQQLRMSMRCRPCTERHGPVVLTRTPGCLEDTESAILRVHTLSCLQSKSAAGELLSNISVRWRAAGEHPKMSPSPSVQRATNRTNKDTGADGAW
jgi:hypothetical protein